jgi:hypothetical protein
MILDGYKPLGGKHPETAALKNVLAYHGVTALHTGQPFSEAIKGSLAHSGPYSRTPTRLGRVVARFATYMPISSTRPAR